MKSSRVGRPPPFLVPNGGLVRMTSAFGSLARRRRERVAERSVALDAVQHRVHQQQAVRVRHQLEADEGLACAGTPAASRAGRKVVGLLLDVAVGGDEEAAGARRRVLDDLARPAASCSCTMHSMSGRGVKYCPAPDFFSLAFFSSRPS